MEDQILLSHFLLPGSFAEVIPMVKNKTKMGFLAEPPLQLSVLLKDSELQWKHQGCLM